MKTVNYIKLNNQLFQLIIPAIFLCILAGAADAQILPPGGSYGPTNTPLDSWSFQDQDQLDGRREQRADFVHEPCLSDLGDGYSLEVNTNVPEDSFGSLQLTRHNSNEYTT